MTSRRPSTEQFNDLDPRVAFLTTLVDPLSRAFGSNCEVVLHDLSNLDNSIVAIAGEFTGRSVGSRPMGLLLSRLQAGNYDDVIGYENVLTDGRLCRSSTIFIWPPDAHPTVHEHEGSPSGPVRDSNAIGAVPPPDGEPSKRGYAADGEMPVQAQEGRMRLRYPAGVKPIAALCINIDLNAYEQVIRATNTLAKQLNWRLPSAPDGTTTEKGTQTTLDSFVLELVEGAISDIGVPVELMKKRHKVAVVARLLEGGMFQVREGVDIVAAALQVSRFTIYNYLNSLDSGDSQDR